MSPDHQRTYFDSKGHSINKKTFSRMKLTTLGSFDLELDSSMPVLHYRFDIP